LRKNVLAFGELLWDLLPDATILGGAPFNFAYRVNTLGDSGLMISRLGRDELGESAFNKVEALGLSTEGLQWDANHPTGTVEVSFDEFNNPDYVIIPGVAYDHIEMTASLRAAASRSDCFCFGTLAQRASASRDTLAQLLESSPQSLKFLDINLRKLCYSRESVISSLEAADVLKLNEDEAREIAILFGMDQQDIPRFCQQIGTAYDLKYCLVTFGDRGAFGAASGGAEVYVPGYVVELEDPLGSGDAFSAGFVHKILRGASLKQACQCGNAMGALVAATRGATAGVGMEQIEEIMNDEAERRVQPELEKYIG